MGVSLARHQAWDRDCRSATGRDFHWAMAGRERRAALGHRDEMEHQDGLEQRRALPLRGALPTAGRKERLAVMLLGRMAEPQAQTDELVLARAHSALARQASPQAVQRGPEEVSLPEPVPPLELQPQALLAPLASRSMSRVQPALRQRAQRWLAAARQARPQASSARPSPRRPLHPSPPWLWLRQPLLLRLVPGGFCGPFRRHPRGWSSNASFFPLRRTRAKGQ